VLGALGKAPIALGKGFAECRTRQRALGKEPVGKGFFVECHISGTWQSLCRVPRKHLAKKNPPSTLTVSLPSATSAALGKKIFFKKILYRVP
jgi:hypothetical protein